MPAFPLTSPAELLQSQWTCWAPSENRLCRNYLLHRSERRGLLQHVTRAARSVKRNASNSCAGKGAVFPPSRGEAVAGSSFSVVSIIRRIFVFYQPPYFLDEFQQIIWEFNCSLCNSSSHSFKWDFSLALFVLRCLRFEELQKKRLTSGNLTVWRVDTEEKVVCRCLGSC